VKKLTPNGQGVDHVIEVGGVGTLRQSLTAVRREGVISCVGSVSGDLSTAKDVPTLIDCWLNNCIARGIAVGSREQLEELVAAVEDNDIHPVLGDKSFLFPDAKAAFEHYVSIASLKNQNSADKACLRQVVPTGAS
jgi:NADPH:quinone reductase-like Zn-dependent oxidoreductase